MKILWVKNDFLHPTDRGGQIRTLETLRRLRENHEIHYIAYDDPRQPEGLARSSEYCMRAYPIHRPIPARNSPAFFRQLAANLVSDLPLAVDRYRSPAMRQQIQSLLAQQSFDSVVCDFLSVAPNFPDIGKAVLFQHNVETMIWRRHAEHAPDPLRRAYFHSQAGRMFATEGSTCRAAAHIIAVSRGDAETMRRLFSVGKVSDISTGVDLAYFRAPAEPPTRQGLVFVGAMDWLPNIDGARFFIQEVLPLIRRAHPRCALVLAGRSPVPEIRSFAAQDPLISVTGTVPDIRPYLWNAAVSIVPLRIGGGTRLKIYEAMAAGTPVVSTPIGAEGLAVNHGADISLAADPVEFARCCTTLLDNPAPAASQASAALRLVSANFSWDQVARTFENILREYPCAA